MLVYRPLVGGMREIRESVADSAYDSVCLSVVDAVSRAVGTDPSRLEPLAGAVDPDVLERLVADGTGGADGGAIVFSMAECQIEVDAGGDITVAVPEALDVDAGAEDDDAGTARADERGSADALPGCAEGDDGLRAGGRGAGATPALDPEAETDADVVDESRYEFTEFTDELGTVAVLYDTANPYAWIQSTSPSPVER